jgi:microcystin degradation protein MlrC
VSYQNIDVIFTQKRSAFISKENFETAGVNIEDYDIIVVKLGYLFSELQPFCDKHYFALTDGSSCVDIRRFNYKKLIRPLYPLDENIKLFQ